MPRTTPLIPDGWYLWLPRGGSLEDKARFGSSDSKTVLKLSGDCYVPDDRGGFRIQRLSREETLAYSLKSNVGTMIGAAIGRLLDDDTAKRDVRAYDRDWEVILDVPMIVRVESHPWSPKDAPDTVYVSTSMKGAVAGWPVGVPLPDAVLNAAALPVPWPRGHAAPSQPSAPAALPAASGAPNPPAQQRPAAQDAPTGPTGQTATLAKPGDTPPAAAAPPVQYPEGWVIEYRRMAAALTASLSRFGFKADAPPEVNAVVISAFWIYFDGVPAVAKLKRYKPDQSVTFVRSPEAGVTTDDLAAAADQLHAFSLGTDVRPPMPAGVAQ